ncbi:MAG TPA: DUF2147 domain-containing protein [Bradyrhizobium sp.]|nr:DUF2147 domain-containing protein [Bradyrhizobium sp.]
MNAVRCCLAAAALLSLSPCLADELSGTWLHEKGNLQVRFEPCGEVSCGTIVWVKPGAETRARVGQRIFFDMRPDGRNSWSGKVAANGSVYLTRLSVDGTSLTTSSCIIRGVICKSANWTRVQ